MAIRAHTQGQLRRHRIKHILGKASSLKEVHMSHTEVVTSNLVVSTVTSSLALNLALSIQALNMAINSLVANMEVNSLHQAQVSTVDSNIRHLGSLEAPTHHIAQVNHKVATGSTKAVLGSRATVMVPRALQAATVATTITATLHQARSTKGHQEGMVHLRAVHLVAMVHHLEVLLEGMVHRQEDHLGEQEATSHIPATSSKVVTTHNLSRATVSKMVAIQDKATTTIRTLVEIGDQAGDRHILLPRYSAMM